MQLTTVERDMLRDLDQRLTTHAVTNAAVGAFYDEDYTVRSIGVTPDLASLRGMVIGWGSTVVDVLEERVNLLGWSVGDAEADKVLGDLFTDSGADAEAHEAHTDAFVYGCGFVSVTAGTGAESPVLVRAHSALHSTAKINARTGLAEYAVTTAGSCSRTLWTDTEVVEMVRDSDTAPWRVDSRTDHHMGRCPVVPLINRSRAGKRSGRSEITPSIRSYITSATRGLRAMDVNREYFSTPQRYGVGLSPDQFVGADGTQQSGWDLVSSKMLLAPRDEDGDAPEFGEFSTVSPGPYLEQIRGLAGLVSTEAGIPESYLGITTANPSSADAIRQMESRLVTRAKRRCTMFSAAWSEIGRMALAILTGTPVDETPRPRCRWGEPGTPTTAATVDALTKLISVGSVPATSELVWEKAGFDDAERRQLRAEVARAESNQRLTALSAMLNGGSTTNALAAMTEDTGDDDDDDTAGDIDS
ncbi:phage portal protein [Corynebacterium variabile]|uniref:phage portal protein n=1 Tax=Corynebacterium variabile TaxID=1727 RepID=UPI003FD598A2